MSAHARIGPSAFSRVIRCPGSVKLTENLPYRTNRAAAEGTVLHDIAAYCLEFGFEPSDFHGQVHTVDGFTFTIGEDEGELDPSCMQEGLDWLREQPGILFVETRVSLDPWLPGQFGTLDVMIWDPATGRLTIYDWKFGQGVPVKALENEQAQGYALGGVETLLPAGADVKEVHIIIEQPRHDEGGRYDDPWITTIDQLMTFGDVLKATWDEVHAENPRISAGRKQCHFCDAKEQPGANGNLSGCSTHDAWVLTVFGVDQLEDLDEQIATGSPIKLPVDVTPERRAHIVKNADLVKKFLTKMHEDSLDAARFGTPDPGMTTDIGRRGARKWTDKEKAELLLRKALRDDAFNRKLKSPAEAEKSLKPKKGKPGDPDTWAALGELITQEPGKLILVEASEARPGIPPITDQLDDLD